MLRLRGPLFVIFAMFVACGGRVLVDENGGGDPGTTGTGVASTGSGTGGSFGTGVAGLYDTGGAVTVGVGGAYGAGGAGFVTGAGGFAGPCGPTLCPAGTQCCNPQCGICVSSGLACPAITCGGSAGSGFGGSVGAAGSFGCGTPDTCLARIPGPARCRSETPCLCKACMCEANMCENDPGCQQIWQCALKVDCHGKECYAPQTCQYVIDMVGLGSSSMDHYLKLDACRSATGCATACGTAVDAGAACSIPPPPLGVPSCTGMLSPDGSQCSQTCVDPQMNTFTSKCSGGNCNCYYNGRLTCACPDTHMVPPCGSCCPSMGW